MKWIKLIWIVVLFPSLTWAQSNRYFVTFKDKAGTPYTVDQPLQFLSQKSIDRRVREGFQSEAGFLATDEDLPPNPDYVQQVRQAGAEVYYTSRWMNGVVIQTSAAVAGSVSNLPNVLSVTLVAPGTMLSGGRAANRHSKNEVLSPSGVIDLAQMQMIGIDLMHAAGYHGEGVNVAVFDAGFPAVNTLSGFASLFQESRIKGTFDYVTNSKNAYVGSEHGTATLSILAGNLSNYLGGAYKANYYLYVTEDDNSEYIIEEYNWLIAAEKADSVGVDVISSSLGYTQFDDPSMDHSYESMNGITTVVSIGAHMASSRGISVVNSAGNYGATAWTYIAAPADAVGVIAVGAVDVTAGKANFSSFGPSADGRVKPDVCAMGVRDVLFSASGCCFVGNGTSFSCPLIAGLVADMRQQYPTESAAKIYDRLIKSSSQYHTPDASLGYGIPNLHGISIDPPGPPQLDLYPNPVEDTLLVKTSYPNGRLVEVTIFNSAGQKAADWSTPMTINNNPMPIDVSSLADGLYYVRISSGGSSLTRKIFKRGK